MSLKSQKARSRTRYDETGDEFLSRKEEWSLAEAWIERKDERARARILRAYDRMAVSYASRAARSGLPFEDLKQEAVIGLIEALDRFDPTRGFGFSTFARYYLISRIQVFLLENLAPVKIFNTATTKTLLARYRRVRTEIEAETGEPLDDAGRDAICAALNVDRVQLDRFEMATQTPVFLDGKRGNGDEGARPLELADASLSPEDEVLSRRALGQLRQVIEGLLSELDEREAQIVYARNFADPSKTLDELSRDFGISRERVRQIELRALQTIKKELVSRGIRGIDSIFGG